MNSWAGCQSNAEWDMRLEDLLGEITVSNSLEHYLGAERTDLMWKPLSSKVRVGWARAPNDEIGDFDIWGSDTNRTALLRACKDGNYEIAQDAIRHTVSECVALGDDSHKHLRKRLDFGGFRPIHWAALGGHCDVIRLLVTNGAKIHTRTSSGWSAIRLAALFGDARAMHDLIKLGMKRQQAHLSELVLSNQNPLLESPMHLRFSHDDDLENTEEASVLESLLDDLGQLQFQLSANCNGETLLHRVAASGMSVLWGKHSTMFEYMSDLRASQTPADHYGRSVLWHAVCGGNVKTVQCLVENDPDSILISDNRGMIPLHAACRLGYAQIVKTLLKAGADPLATTSAPGLTPAHYAALYSHYECLMVFIGFGKHVHQSTKSYDIAFRPIHLAAANGHLRSFEILRDAGSDMDWTCTHYIILRSQLSEKETWTDRLELVECHATVRDLAASSRRDEADVFELSALRDPSGPTLEGASAYDMHLLANREQPRHHDELRATKETNPIPDNIDMMHTCSPTNHFDVITIWMSSLSMTSP
ncbi:ankyrin repeat-containing domain protein [Xylariaceae sp. FL1019]|nr:ankyrin repeat-containing domain protein [Xylariaceae sp. FL1019]